MHPEPMSANMTSASAARVGLAKFVTEMESVSRWIYDASPPILANRSAVLNAAVQGVRDGIAAMGRFCDSKKKVSVENFDGAGDRCAIRDRRARGDSRSPRTNHASS